MAPAFVLVGAWTRLWAVVYALNIAFATLLVHARDFARLAPTGGWAAELYAFYITGPIVVALLGPGRYALRRGKFPWDRFDAGHHRQRCAALQDCGGAHGSVLSP